MTVFAVLFELIRFTVEDKASSADSVCAPSYDSAVIARAAFIGSNIVIPEDDVDRYSVFVRYGNAL